MKESVLLSLPPEQQNKAKKSRKRKRKNAAATAADTDSQNTSSGVFKVTEGGGVKASTSDIPVDKPANQSKEESTEPSKKKRKRNKNKKNKNVGESAPKVPKTTSGKDSVNADIRMSDDRLKAYGLVPNQYKRKVKKAKYMKKWNIQMVMWV